MAARVRRNRQGFTLIEVLVTMMVLAFGMMASLVGVMAAIDHTLLNDMRSEAMKLGQEQMEAARNMPFVSIQTIPAVRTVQRQFRKSMTTFTINTDRVSATGYANDMTKLSITVQWVFKNRTYSYLLESIVRQTK
jgi:prepilin-type N-terminal cleavage/methylation domain-containing protein